MYESQVPGAVPRAFVAQLAIQCRSRGDYATGSPTAGLGVLATKQRRVSHPRLGIIRVLCPDVLRLATLA